MTVTNNQQPMINDDATTAAEPSRARPRTRSLAHHVGLFVALGVGLLLRALLWGRTPRTGLISDEGEYVSAAHWLAQGRGFAWYLGYLWTRAPLYPLFLAAHLRLFGDALTPVYITQILLSLVNVALVYWLARALCPPINDQRAPTTDRRVTWSACYPGVAALLMAIYLPFALYTQVLLSETLYLTLLLGGFLALALADRQPPTTDHQDLPRHRVIVSSCHRVIAGALFGLATLTRSLTLGFVPLVILWLLFTPPHLTSRIPHPASRVSLAFLRALRGSSTAIGLFTLTFCLFMLPWTWYNSSRLYGGLVVVDTSGAYNLMLGARTAADGTRLDAPSRDFVRALLDPTVKPSSKVTVEQTRTQLLNGFPDANGRTIGRSCLLARGDPRLLAALARPYAPEPSKQTPQAQVQQLMTGEGLCLIAAHPASFVQKSLGEFVDFFQINYTGDERFTDGFTTGRLPTWYALALFLLDDTLYVLVLPLAVIGYALMQKSSIKHQASSINLIGLWFAYTVLVAPLLFAINRFRLPLLPFAFIFAAYALVQLPRAWRLMRARAGVVPLAVAAALLAMALPSYIGTSWSSTWYTRLALAARQSYRNTAPVQMALHRGDAPAASALLANDLTKEGRVFAPVLVLALETRYDDALKLLDQTQATMLQAAQSDGRGIPDDDRVKIAVIRGEILRSKGDTRAALDTLSQMLVDKSNPVQWAWDWLHPQATSTINVGGSLDLGYVAGCYLGEGDTSITPPANFRWCTDGAQLRFPGGGTGEPQTLVLRADGRGWPSDMLPVPPVRVLLGATEEGTFTPNHRAVKEFTVALPPTPRGADVVVTLRVPTFIPDAVDYLSQQGPLVGQVRRLGVRLDRVELR